MTVERDKAGILLEHALQAMAPLLQSALLEGVTYPQFAQALKAEFFELARSELKAQGKKLTDSAISVLSGVHRKDVKTLGQGRPRLPRALSVASQVYTRWMASPDTVDASGAPIALARSGPAPSFDALALSVTRNVHPRTVLEELQRLKLVELAGDQVVPLKTSFVPSAGFADMAAFLAANVSDHAAAACANLAGQSPPFLEQSVFADGLTPESIELLALQARQSWKRNFDDTVALASQLYERDKDRSGAMRMRVGMYFYAAPAEDDAPGKTGAPADKPDSRQED